MNCDTHSMQTTPWHLGPAAAALLLVSAGALAQAPQAMPEPAQASYVSDRHAQHRPDGAPVLASTPVDQDTQRRRLKGVSQPWPGNLARIAAQGAWYSPMFLPGMTGPYDLRGLHNPAAP